MKTREWIKIFCISLVFGAPTLQAVSVNVTEQEITLDALDMGFSTYEMTYTYIPGFLVSPLQVKGELLAPFGQIRMGYNHEGIDIRAAEGTPIFAIADGVVTKAAPDSKGVENGGGHMIFIDFGDGVEGRYMHLSAYAVQTGDQVKQGQVIGFTGNTGDSTTPHLHFEYRVAGVPLDPAFIFEASGMIEGQSMIATYSTVMSSSITDNSNLEKESFYVLQQ